MTPEIHFVGDGVQRFLFFLGVTLARVHKAQFGPARESWKAALQGLLADAS